MNNRIFAVLSVFFAVLLALPNAARSQPDVPAPLEAGAAPLPALTAPAPADESLHVAVWDRGRVQSESKAGQVLTEYAEGYAAVMDANIATLNNAIAAKMPGLKVAEARKLAAQYKERKAEIRRAVNDFLIQLVTGAAAELPMLSRAVLIEKTAVTWAAADADATGVLIAALDAVNVELPPLPQKLELRPPQPAPRQPAKPADKTAPKTPSKPAPKPAPAKNSGRKK